MTDPIEREAFEKWWVLRGHHKPSRNTEPGYSHEYDSPTAEQAWQGWQAALALPSARVGGGEEAALEQLRAFVAVKRFDRETFQDDTAMVDWMLSRARYVIANRFAAPVALKSEGEIAEAIQGVQNIYLTEYGTGDFRVTFNGANRIAKAVIALHKGEK